MSFISDWYWVTCAKRGCERHKRQTKGIILFIVGKQGPRQKVRPNFLLSSKQTNNVAARACADCLEQRMSQQNNPLHGVKLVHMIETLYEYYGWDQLFLRIPVRCFSNQPSVKSSLTFLRKTPWAREKVEQLYLDTFPNGVEEKL